MLSQFRSRTADDGPNSTSQQQGLSRLFQAIQFRSNRNRATPQQRLAPQNHPESRPSQTINPLFHHHHSYADGGEDYQRLQQSNAYLKHFEATLDAASNILELADTLQTNTSIETVRANIHGSFAGTRPTEDMLVFFEALGSRPALRSVFLGTFRYPQVASLPVQPLGLALISASRLSFLEVCGLELTGSSSDFTTLGASLHKHPSLKEVKIYNCRIEQSDPSLLDPLVQSLGSIHSLQKVVLNAAVKNALGNVSAQSLGMLCGASNLKAIGLLGFDWQDEHIVALTKALTNNTTLKEVCLGQVQLGVRGDEALAKLLRSNDSALEYLDLQLEDEASPLQVAQALAHTTTLKHCFLHGALTPKSQQVLAEATTTSTASCALESLELMNGSPYMPAMRFRLRMNSILRKANLTNSTTNSQQDWFRVWMAHRNDLSASFYLLSRNPLLVVHAIGMLEEVAWWLAASR